MSHGTGPTLLYFIEGIEQPWIWVRLGVGSGLMPTDLCIYLSVYAIESLFNTPPRSSPSRSPAVSRGSPSSALKAHLDYAGMEGICFSSFLAPRAIIKPQGCIPAPGRGESVFPQSPVWLRSGFFLIQGVVPAREKPEGASSRLVGAWAAVWHQACF